MNIQFTNPAWLWLLPVAVGWIVWISWKSDVQISPWRRWTSLGVRLVVVLLVVLAIAGLQWLKPLEGMNVFYLLDRSDSIPGPQQELTRDYVNQSFEHSQEGDRGGVLVFGTDAALESSAQPVVDLQKIHAVIGTERTDIAGAVRLARGRLAGVDQVRYPSSRPDQALRPLSRKRGKSGLCCSRMGMKTPATRSARSWPPARSE